MNYPKPNPGEPKEEFMRRCVKSDAIVAGVPRRAERRAVCEMIWEDNGETEYLGAPDSPGDRDDYIGSEGGWDEEDDDS